MQSPLSQESSPPLGVAAHEVDSIMKVMDRADGVLASLSLGTCVRNVGSPVSCLLPGPSILFFSWAVPMGQPGCSQ